MKKLVSLLLALMLCLGTVPVMAEMGVIGGADGPTTIILSEHPGFVLPDDFAAPALEAGRRVVTYASVTEMQGIRTGSDQMDAALTDMIKAVGLYMAAQGEESEFALTISDIDVLNLSTAISGSDLYLKSNLLGDALVIGAAEVEGLFSRLLDMLVMMEAMTAEEAEEIKAIFGSAFGTFSAAQQQVQDAMLTEADLLAMDYSAIVSVLGGIVEKVQPVGEIVIPKSCDAAAGGYVMTATNEDIIALAKAAIQVVKDNPKLMNFIASQIGYMTEDQLEAMWADMEAQTGGISKEAFFAAYPNFNAMLEDADAQLDGKKILDGECVTHIYCDAEGAPVYATFVLPLFFETEPVYVSDSTQMGLVPQGNTVMTELVYSRQTVAQGVSHVFNLTVDGTTLTADVLISGNAAHIVLSVPDAEPVIIDVMVEGNHLWATLQCNPDEATSVTCTFDGTYLCTDTDYELNGKLVLKHESTPAQVETPSVNGMTLPGFEARKPQPRTDVFTLDVHADYTRDGVDYNGATDIAFEYNDVRVALQIKAWTEAAADSIMTGDVVRPAALEDAAFTNWFVDIINNINGWLGNLMMALPESVLTLIMSGSM